jgi:hypothetical protein
MSAFTLHTIDIKLAAVLISSGITQRKTDPITCEVQYPNGKRHEQFTFWFEIPNTDEAKEHAQGIMNAYFAFVQKWDMALGEEHPLYYMIGVLQNREVLLHWIRTDVEPLKRTTVGKMDILVSERATPELKNKLRQQALNMR